MSGHDEWRPFSAGNVLSRSVSVLFTDAPMFFGITALVWLPLILLQVGTANLPPELVGGDFEPVKQGLTAAGQLATLIAQPIATAAIIHGVFSQLRGEHSSFGTCLGTGFSRLLGVLIYTLIQTILVGIGYCLCVIPGIVLLVRFYVGLPSLVVEGLNPGEALRRSENLVEGNGWGVFGLLLILGVLNWILAGGTGMLLAAAGVAEIPGLFQGITGLTSIITTTLSAVVTCVTYYELRVQMDDISSDDLLSVFD